MWHDLLLGCGPCGHARGQFVETRQSGTERDQHSEDDNVDEQQHGHTRIDSMTSVITPFHSKPRTGGNTCTIAAVLEVPNGKGRTGTDELEKTYSWSAHCSRDDGGDVCPAQRKYAAGSLSGAISHDGRSMGDFRVALRETEITNCSAFGVHRIAFDMGETASQEVIRFV